MTLEKMIEYKAKAMEILERLRPLQKELMGLVHDVLDDSELTEAEKESIHRLFLDQNRQQVLEDARDGHVLADMTTEEFLDAVHEEQKLTLQDDDEFNDMVSP